MIKRIFIKLATIKINGSTEMQLLNHGEVVFRGAVFTKRTDNTKLVSDGDD